MLNIYVNCSQKKRKSFILNLATMANNTEKIEEKLNKKIGKRDKKRRIQMAVSGKSVLALQKIIKKK